jgi:hypothetical protein
VDGGEAEAGGAGDRDSLAWAPSVTAPPVRLTAVAAAPAEMTRPTPAATFRPLTVPPSNAMVPPFDTVMLVVLPPEDSTKVMPLATLTPPDEPPNSSASVPLVTS